jgi:hypothetical protein
MPRYRFNWANLPADLLSDLATDLRLEGDPPEALRSWYGARPKHEFVQDAWQTLLRSWLGGDPVWARHVAKRLRTRNLGDTSLRQDVAYLQSVRNTSGMRQGVLDIFIEYGEQTSGDRAVLMSVHGSADTPADAPSSETTPPCVAASPQVVNDTAPEDEEPAGGDSLLEFVASVLADLLGQVHFDADGDFVVPYGSAVAYVRVLNEPPAVRLFAVLLSDVPASPRVLEVINSINTQLLLGRLVYLQGAVVLEHTLLPMGLSADEVSVTLRMIASAADNYDDLLQRAIGGSLAGHQPAEDEIEV